MTARVLNAGNWTLFQYPGYEAPMTQLHIAILRQLLHFSARGRRGTITDLSRRLRVPPSRIVAGLRSLEAVDLCVGTRLTLPGLALAVATRRGRPGRRAVALAA